MSMPSFPGIDPDITCERALNMILASIAMEEMALSNIINAEGEKLQCVLGAFGASGCKCPDVDEILRVNQSVTCLLDSVSQNQMILKNKMDRALCALASICPPKPPSPPETACKCPCKYLCKCSAVFKAAERCKLWCAGTDLRFCTEHLCGKCICLDSCGNDRVKLCSRGRFAVSFFVNVVAKGHKCNVAIAFQSIKKNQCKEIYTIRSDINSEGAGVTISTGNIVVENGEGVISLRIRLESPESLMVEDCMLNILEI